MCIYIYIYVNTLKSINTGLIVVVIKEKVNLVGMYLNIWSQNWRQENVVII